MAELKADVRRARGGHGRCWRGAAPAKTGPGCHPGRPPRTCRRGDQLWQCRDRGVRLGVSLYVPAGFCRDPALCAEPAPQVRYRFTDLPTFLPWLVRYYLASSPQRALHSAMAELPLIQRSLIEHEALVAEAGGAGIIAQDRLDQAFSGGSVACKGRARCRARQAIWRRQRHPRRQGDRSPRAASVGRLRRRGAFSGARASFPIPAGWQKPMRRCSAARAAAFLSAMPVPSNNPAGDGGWQPTRAR